ADGRSRVFINDQPASVTLLRQVGHLLVEIHGQHDDRALVDADAHRDLLDAFGGLSGRVEGVRAAYSRFRSTTQELSRHRARVDAAALEAEYLRPSIEGLGKLHPQRGEEDDLAEERAQMMRAEKIASDIADADEVLSGNASPLPTLSSLLRRLQRKSTEVPGLLDEIIQCLDEAMLNLDAAQSAVDQAMRATEFDPKRLEQAEERLFALRAAGRKYNVAVSELPALRGRMDAELADLDAGEERLGVLEKAVEDARMSYDKLAAELSRERHEASTSLAEAVMAELPALKLERARFIVHIESDAEDRQESGIDKVEFWVQTKPGTRAGQIMKVAAGGELSRFLLALKVALADRGSAPTLVFDEIDTGVGGAVADAIGQRLARLAERIQVLSVTHAPQVAARARTHYLISKTGTADRVATGIIEMDRPARQEEIARMLAGATITDEARAAAERLLRENAA